ncbi:MAG: extracellular solute-binding protein [Chloroflexi bacterium]|nr:extracellular solute-binding protein [Chloroflexota bacterium]
MKSQKIWLSLIGFGLLALSAACAPATPTATPQPTAPPVGETVHVSILNRDMTRDEIVAAIQEEGGLVVANWTYTANDELVNQFQKYVRDSYGVNITLTYEGSQAPSTYLTNLYAAQAAGNPPPYDVMAIEENYWADAVAHNAPEAYLPSGLIPNQALVLDQFQHVPTSIAFQSTAFPGVVYSRARAGWMTKLTDLADPRLRGRITLPLPGDITAGGVLVSLAAELGKDYRDPDQMKEVVDYVVDNLVPNALKLTTDSSEMQQLLRSGAVDAVVFWNSLARLEFLGGNADAGLLISPSGVFAVNGYLWIPKGAPHPVLAQIFINWRLSPEVQLPNDWPIDHGPWSEFHEGFLGPAYVDRIPAWFQADYYTYFPTLDQIQTQFKTLDWEAYNTGVDEWMDYYSERLGL